jgi:hypothetical protein
MAGAQTTVDLAAVSKTASQPIIDALNARIEPGGVTISDDDSVANGLRWVAAVLLTAFCVIALLGVHAKGDTNPKRMKAIIGNAMFMWLAIWAALGPFRLYWRKRRLPWKPGVYAIGPHVVDARSSKLRFFVIQSVDADLDGDRGAHRPCLVHVTSTWKKHTIRIKDRDVAIRVRDQLNARKGELYTQLVAADSAARLGDPGGAPRDPLALRFAFLTAAVLSAAITVPLAFIV